jgi:hypothetical protein
MGFDFSAMMQKWLVLVRSTPLCWVDFSGTASFT